MMYYLRLFMRTFYISLIVAVIVTVSYYIYDYNYGTFTYEASAGILVNEDVNSPYFEKGDGAVITDTDFAEYLLNVAIYYLNTPEYQEAARAKLANSIPEIESYDFNKNVKTSTFTGSNVVTITAKYENNSKYPVLIANALAEVYKEINAQKLGDDYFIIISRATQNPEPVNMSTAMSCTLYGVGSLLLTFVLILTIDSLARSEGTYLSWRLFRRRKRSKEVILEEAG